MIENPTLLVVIQVVVNKGLYYTAHIPQKSRGECCVVYQTSSFTLLQISVISQTLVQIQHRPVQCAHSVPMLHAIVGKLKALSLAKKARQAAALVDASYMDTIVYYSQLHQDTVSAVYR